MISYIKNHVIPGSVNKPILIDVAYKKNQQAKKILIFSHGFKGFKDWGAFNKIAKYFAKNDFVFIKFNFSYNGTSLENTEDFVDLKAFGNNNFSIELDDLKCVLDWVHDNNIINDELDYECINLFGHSRGGGISLLKSFEDNRISKVISWASPADFISKLPKGEKLDTWKKSNVAYVYNARTNQNMPMYYQFYENCIINKNRIDIRRAVSNSNIPILIVHGEKDPTVPITDAYKIKSWNKLADLHIIKNADHVMNAAHPFLLSEFPKELKEALDATLFFLKN